MWVEKINRKGWSPTKNHAVCEVIKFYTYSTLKKKKKINLD